MADLSLPEIFIESVEEETIVRLFYELLSAVHFLHKSHFYHCDIKPENILLRNDVLKLADFSLTHSFNAPPSVCQTTIYATPEIYPRLDIVAYMKELESIETLEEREDLSNSGVVIVEFYYN